MDVSSELETFLSGEEIENISESNRTKICRHIGNLRTNLERVNADYAKLTKDKDEREDSLSLELRALERDIEQRSNGNDQQISTISKLQEQLVTVTEQCRQAEQLATSADSEKHAVSRQLEQLRSEQLQLVEQLSRRARDGERQAAELEDLRQQLAGAEREKCQALLRVQEVASKESAIQFRERRMEMDKDLLQRQLDSVNEQLKENTELLVTKRREAASASMKLQLQLSKSQDQLESARGECERLKLANSDLESRLGELMESLRQQRDSELELEQNYRQQLASQTRLAKLYKDNAELAESRTEETAATLQELRQLLTSSDANQQRLQTQLTQTARQHADELAARDASIAQLQQQLNVCEQNLQEMVKRGGVSDEAVEQLAPSAAAVSRVLSSGLSLTQIFSELCAAQDAEAAVRAENAQLQESARLMIADIEKRAVHVRQLREDYEAALTTIETLKESGDKVGEALSVVREELVDWRQQATTLSAEKHRLSAQCGDLSAQVCLLLAELEETRGGVVSRDDDDSNKDAHQESATSNQLISSKLVTFRSIEQLQRRNQELLAVVRELSASDSQHQQPDQHQHPPDSHLQGELESLRQQLSELQEARRREVTLVDSLVRQRDLYRSLVKGHGPTSQETGDQSSAGGDPARSVITSPDRQPLPPSQPADTEHVTLLKQQLDQLREEYDFYKSEQKENAKVLHEQLEQHKNLLSEHRVRNVKLSSRLEYNDQRFGIVNANCEQYRRQVAALEDKYKQSAAINAKYEETIAALRENALSLQERVSRAEVRGDHLQQQLSAARQSEVQLMAERDVVHREATSASLLLSSIEHIKNNLQQAETNAFMNYQNQVDTLKREVSTWKTKCEQDSGSHRQTVLALEAELQSLRSSKECLETTKAELEGKLEQREEREVQLEEELNKLKAARVPRPPSSGVDSTLRELAEVRELHDQLSSSRQQLQLANDKLAAADQRLKQHQSVAEAAEVRIAEADRAVLECRSALQQQLSEKEEALAAASEQVADLRARCDGLEQQLEESKVGNCNDRELEELRQQHSEAQLELKEMQDMLKQVQSSCSEENRNRLEAEERYQREVCQHAEDLQALTACRGRLADLESSVSGLSEARAAAEARLSEQQLHWQQQQTASAQQLAAAVSERQQLLEQNNTLLEQLERLGQKLAAAQERLQARSDGAADVSEAADTSADVSFSERDATSSAQLLEVVGYLRRQRQVADASVLTLQDEVERQRGMLAAQERRCAELQQRLDRCSAADSSAETVSLQSTSEHAQLLRKLETLSAVTDSNRLLRREHTQLTEQCQKLEQMLEDTRQQLLPLKEENGELLGNVAQLEDTLVTVRAERDRWLQRTNQLTERATKVSPEELQQLQKDKEEVEKENGELQRRVSSGQHELTRVRQQITSLSAELQQANNQLEKLKQEGERLEGQVTAARTETGQLRTRNSQLVQQNGLVQKKFKEMSELAEQREKQLEKLREEIEKITAESVEKQTKLGELQTSNMKLKTIGRKYKTQFEQLQTESDQLRRQLSEATAVPAAAASGNDQLKTELEQLKTSSRQHDEKNKTFITQLRQKLLQLSAENKQLKERSSATSEDSADMEMRMDVLKSQYTSRVAALEKSLAEARATDQQHESTCQTLRKRLSALEKQISLYQGKAVTTGRLIEDNSSASCAGSATIISPSAVRTPTANIRPLVPSGAGSGGASGAGATLSRTTPTASIRPMKPASAGTVARSRAALVPGHQLPAEAAVATVSPTPAAPPAALQQAPPTSAPEVQAMSSEQDLTSTLSGAPPSSDTAVAVSAVQPLLVSSADTVTSAGAERSSSQPDAPLDANTQLSTTCPSADSAPVSSSAVLLQDTQATEVVAGNTVASSSVSSAEASVSSGGILVSPAETSVSSGSIPVSSTEAVSTVSTLASSVEAAVSSISSMAWSVTTEASVSEGSSTGAAAASVSSTGGAVASAGAVIAEATVGETTAGVATAGIKRAAEHGDSTNDQAKRARADFSASVDPASNLQTEKNEDEVICLDSDEEQENDSDGMEVTETEDEEEQEEEEEYEDSAEEGDEEDADEHDLAREADFGEDNQVSTEEADELPETPVDSSEQKCDSGNTETLGDDMSALKPENTPQQQQHPQADQARTSVAAAGDDSSPLFPSRGRLTSHRSSGRGSRRAHQTRPGRPQPIVWTPQAGPPTQSPRGFRQLQRARRTRGARSFGARR